MSEVRSAQSFKIIPARTSKQIDAVRRLFDGYARSLPVDLAYQDFATEFAELPGKYAPPMGELLFAVDDAGVGVGCVALRSLSEGKCEMKRLFVSEQARSLGLGKALAIAVVSAAHRLGYSELYLDTLATMERAAALYERMGFEWIDPYYSPTPPGTIFMRLHL